MATTVIKTTFQLKRGSADRWVELNLVLAAGEPGFEIDTNRLKIGDGKTPWTQLPYIGETGIVNALTYADFPKTGTVGVIYKAEKEKSLYQWSSTANSYELLGGNAASGDITIDLELSETSENAISNKAVTNALRALEAKIPNLSYSFGDGLKVEEHNGVQTISVDYEAIKDLIPEIDISGLATKADLEEITQSLYEIQQAIQNLKIPSKLSELENDIGFLTEIPDQYVQRDEITDFATTEYVREQIANASLGGEVDLSDYAKKSDVENALQSFVPTRISYGEF